MVPTNPGSIRVVFDSSARCQGVSLNDTLLKGPDLSNSLLAILLRFRKDAVALMADIQQMFHCFYVKEDNRDFLIFLWHKDNDLDKELVEYRMRVHTFGNSPSPAIATYGLRKAASSVEEDFGDDVCDFVSGNVYVDNGLLSLPDASRQLMFSREPKTLCGKEDACDSIQSPPTVGNLWTPFRQMISRKILRTSAFRQKACRFNEVSALSGTSPRILSRAECPTKRNHSPKEEFCRPSGVSTIHLDSWHPSS